MTLAYFISYDSHMKFSDIVLLLYYNTCQCLCCAFLKVSRVCIYLLNAGTCAEIVYQSLYEHGAPGFHTVSLLQCWAPSENPLKMESAKFWLPAANVEIDTSFS